MTAVPPIITVPWSSDLPSNHIGVPSNIYNIAWYECRKQKNLGNTVLKLSRDTRFQLAFAACCCVFIVIMLVRAKQCSYFDNATTFSKRTLKTRVATSLKRWDSNLPIDPHRCRRHWCKGNEAFRLACDPDWLSSDLGKGEESYWQTPSTRRRPHASTSACSTSATIKTRRNVWRLWNNTIYSIQRKFPDIFVHFVTLVTICGTLWH